MDKKLGQHQEDIYLRKKDEELVSQIIERRGFPESSRDQVYKMMRYNMWTVNQFSELTGLHISSINNMLRPSYRGPKLDTALDYCYPFKAMGSDGPKFILRNDKSELYLNR